MQIFAIKDDFDIQKNNKAFLVYYEREKRFYIELPEEADEWDTPLLLSSFVKRGERTVNSYWSKLWVQQRIVPPDRQNLGQILRDNNLDSYDEFELLILSEGRCAQDSYYLAPVTENDLPQEFKARFMKKVEDVVPLSKHRLLLFFRNGSIKKCAVEPFVGDNPALGMLLKNNDAFLRVKVQTGGYGVIWDENMRIADDVLYTHGESVPLSAEDFAAFAANRVVTTAEASKILKCTRQNIDDLVRRGKLHPIKTSPKNKLFLKSEIMQRNWQ